MLNIKELQSELSKKLEIKNLHALPVVEKVVINVGTGKYEIEPKLQEEAIKTLTIISGQKPVVTHAKKAIAGFKIRENDSIGVKVTLRGKRMYAFLERLANLVLPRLRDFKGVSEKSFDKEGNYTMPIKEQIVFPEIPYNEIQKVHGMQITIKISNSDKKKSKILIETIGMPFTKNNNQSKKG